MELIRTKDSGVRVAILGACVTGFVLVPAPIPFALLCVPEVPGAAYRASGLAVQRATSRRIVVPCTSMENTTTP